MTKLVYHESTKKLKHEKEEILKFRAFLISCFRGCLLNGSKNFLFKKKLPLKGPR